MNFLMEPDDRQIFNSLNQKINLKLDDIYCLNLLQPLVGNYPFLPMTGGSLRPFCLVHLLNDLLINQRKSIIEFGSGISTILIGRLIQRQRLRTQVISIEHEKKWTAELRKVIKKEQLDKFVTVINAPLVKCKLHPDNNYWYDLNVLDNHIEKRKKFDMVIIDGPPAWQQGKELARYPALPYLKNKLSERVAIYLDDANRNGEQTILHMWQKKYSINFTLRGSTLAVYTSGHAYYTEPFAYYG